MTINLTAVLITVIICLTFCYVGKNSESKKKEQQAQQAAGDNMIEIPHFVNHTKSKQAQHLAERMKEQGKEKGEN